MVFQNYAVFPHMTVRQNVGFGLRMAGTDAARIERQVARAAALLHIEPNLDRYPAQLSGNIKGGFFRCVSTSWQGWRLAWLCPPRYW